MRKLLSVNKLAKSLGKTKIINFVVDNGKQKPNTQCHTLKYFSPALSSYKQNK
jgi:hypothetical protein